MQRTVAVVCVLHVDAAAHFYKLLADVCLSIPCGLHQDWFGINHVRDNNPMHMQLALFFIRSRLIDRDCLGECLSIIPVLENEVVVEIPEKFP